MLQGSEPVHFPGTSALFGLGLLLTCAKSASGCAQPITERTFATPPPDPITKDAGFFMPGDEHEDEEEGDGDDAELNDESEEDGGAVSGTDAGTPSEGDGAVAALPDAGPAPCEGTRCGASCVDLDTDSAHCGACDHACPGAAACSAGRCESPSSDCTYALRGDHDYLFCSNQSTWVKAREQCRAFGLDLAIVDDAEENAFLTGSRSRWIGLVNDGNRPFRWIVPGGDDDGAALGFTAWAEDEPNNARDCLIPIPGFPLVCTYEDCGELLASGTWNDAYCEASDTKRDYVCESY